MFFSMGMEAPQARVRIGIEARECFTALGNAEETHSALLAGKVGLKATPVLGKDGGDAVPLALMTGYDETVPPRWTVHLDRLVAKIPDCAWGTAKFPVFVTSSNFDVGSLFAYRTSGSADYLGIGTPAQCLRYFKKRYGWGENVLALSHACVSAHLGVDMASQHLGLGVAEKALVFTFDFISPFVSGGFHSLKILNEWFPAPYQEREIGSIGLGDGCGFVVLSKEETSARIESNFLYNEMYHFTANEPGGSGFRAAAEWLKAAAERPLWIKGHGTGTLDAGRLEAAAFWAALPGGPLVSWKGSIGHTLGSCGVVELVLALRSIESGWAPGTVGGAAPTMFENVSLDPLSTGDFGAVGLFSNAFGGAHAGCLIGYD